MNLITSRASGALKKRERATRRVAPTTHLRGARFAASNNQVWRNKQTANAAQLGQEALLQSALPFSLGESLTQISSSRLLRVSTEGREKIDFFTAVHLSNSARCQLSELARLLRASLSLYFKAYLRATLFFFGAAYFFFK